MLYSCIRNSNWYHNLTLISVWDSGASWTDAGTEENIHLSIYEYTLYGGTNSRRHKSQLHHHGSRWRKINMIMRHSHWMVWIFLDSVLRAFNRSAESKTTATIPIGRGNRTFVALRFRREIYLFLISIQNLSGLAVIRCKHASSWNRLQIWPALTVRKSWNFSAVFG